MTAEFDFSERPNPGTGCVVCRNDYNHFCPATGYWYDIPICTACGTGIACDAQKAHYLRLSGIVEPEEAPAPPVVKTLPVAGYAPIRDEEWRSDWRKGLELSAKNVEHMKRVRGAVSPSPRKSKPRLTTGFCIRCQAKLYVNNTHGYCRSHRPHHVAYVPLVPTKFCSVCEIPLRNVNQSGLCGKHFHPSRLVKCNRDDCQRMIHRDHNNLGVCTNHRRKLQGILKHGPRPTCSHVIGDQRCAEIIFRNNTWGLCRWHGPHKQKKYVRDSQPQMATSPAQPSADPTSSGFHPLEGLYLAARDGSSAGSRPDLPMHG
jgi:hypothetical protein